MYQKKGDDLFLEFGETSDRQLVHIEETTKRGRQCGLVCPFCGEALLAKKGKKLAHHFAHDGSTCRAVSERENLIPYIEYNRFAHGLKPRDLEIVEGLFKRFGKGRFYETDLSLSYFNWERILNLDLVVAAYRDKRGNPLFKLGKRALLALGQLSCRLFSEMFWNLFRDREGFVQSNTRRFFREDRLMFNALKRRMLLNGLYFLRIPHEAGDLYKIGITTRTPNDRIREITPKLQKHFSLCGPVTCLGFWPHQTAVEAYFKFKYQAFRFSFGSETEYFQFEDIKPVLRDLRGQRLPELNRSERTVVLMQEKRREGKQIGRPKGGENPDIFLGKPKNQEIAQCLKQGLSLRATAKHVKCSVNTVVKVRDQLKP